MSEPGNPGKTPSRLSLTVAGSQNPGTISVRHRFCAFPNSSHYELTGLVMVDRCRLQALRDRQPATGDGLSGATTPLVTRLIAGITLLAGMAAFLFLFVWLFQTLAAEFGGMDLNPAPFAIRSPW